MSSDPTDETRGRGFGTTGGADDETQPNTTVMPAGKSRRDFLKAAVIGSAGVAAAGGAAAAALALTGKQAPLIRFVGSLMSPTDPCAICFSHTTAGGTSTTCFDTSGSFNTTNDVFVWVRFLNVTGGASGTTYSADVTNQDTGCVGQEGIGTGSCAIFTYHGFGIKAFTSPASLSQACVPCAQPPGTDPSSGVTYSNLTFTGTAFPVTFTVAAGVTEDVLFQVQTKPNVSAGTYTLGTSLTNTATNAVVDTCTNTVTFS